MGPLRGLRVGAIPYLNALPLVQGLVGVRYGRPSDHATMLENGEVDLVAALSLGATLSRPEWRVLPSTGVACDGPVRTVMILHAGPLGEVRRLAPDSASRTSNLLARWLVARQSGQDPSDASPESAQARVIIGDAAFSHDPGEGTDMGAAWKEATGLPFVFAGWVAGGALAEDRARLVAIDAWLVARLATARDRLEEIIATQSVVPPSVARSYLTENIHHQLDERFRAGADRFATEVAAMGEGGGSIPWAC